MSRWGFSLTKTPKPDFFWVSGGIVRTIPRRPMWPGAAKSIGL